MPFLSLLQQPTLRSFAAVVSIAACSVGFAQGQGSVAQGTAQGQAGSTVSSRGGSIASAQDEWRRVTVGFIGQSRYEPRSVAAFAGAVDAAAALGPDMETHVQVVNRSPEAATAAEQNAALSELFVSGFGGALIHPVSVAESASLMALLGRQRMPLVTLGSADVVAGISGMVVDDEEAIGKALATEAFRLLRSRPRGSGEGIAILAGPQGRAPYSTRAQAAQRAVEGSAEYAWYNTYHNEAGFSASLDMLNSVTRAERNERLGAWVSVGGWPLEGHHGQLPRHAGLAGFVVAEGLPSMLPYLERGEVAALVSPDYYKQGYEAMRLLLQMLPSETAGASESTGADGTTTAATDSGRGLGSSGAEASVRRVLVLPRIIRKENLPEYFSEWTRWLGQPL